MSKHLWITGERAADAARAVTELPAPDTSADCHRNRCGPYTGLGSLVLALVPTVQERWPDLVQAHQIEILTAAPQLRELIAANPETLTSLAQGEERTRFYSEARSSRTPHGIVELLNEYVARRGAPLVLDFGNVHAADPSDQEFLAIALRRLDPAVVRLRLSGRADPGTVEQHDGLGAALGKYAEHRVVSSGPSQTGRAAQDGSAEAGGPANDQEDLLRAFIEADCTGEDPAELAAYQAADPALRAELHDRRAERLVRDGHFGHTLGAIPYHREHGSDPAGAGTAALREALDYCIDLGFYYASADLGLRGRALVDPETRQFDYCHFTAKAALALISLGRADDAMELYVELRGRYPLPRVHMSTSYNMAMLYTRFLPKDRLDHELARAYASNGVALASLTEDPIDRAFYTVFQQNGLALVEMHRGNLTEALRLVSEGGDRLMRDTPAESYRLHKSVLIHNRANVYAAMGMLQESMADLNTVISLDPSYPEYYLDRGNMARRLGDDDAAVADYEKAMELGPPFPELFHNRGDVRAARGDMAGALADLSYALELEPGHAEARVNHAGLLMEMGDLAGAAASAEAGLEYHPDHPMLHYIRAVHAYDEGLFEAAVEFISTALEHSGEDPDLLYNRGRAHQAAHHWDEAIRDYTRAMDMPGADLEELSHQRALCMAAGGR